MQISDETLKILAKLESVDSKTLREILTNSAIGEVFKAIVMKNLEDNSSLLFLKGNPLIANMPVRLQEGQEVLLKLISGTPNIVFSLLSKDEAGIPVNLASKLPKGGEASVKSDFFSAISDILKTLETIDDLTSPSKQQESISAAFQGKTPITALPGENIASNLAQAFTGGNLRGALVPLKNFIALAQNSIETGDYEQIKKSLKEQMISLENIILNSPNEKIDKGQIANHIKNILLTLSPAASQGFSETDFSKIIKILQIFESPLLPEKANAVINEGKTELAKMMDFVSAAKELKEDVKENIQKVLRGLERVFSDFGEKLKTAVDEKIFKELPNILKNENIKPEDLKVFKEFIAKMDDVQTAMKLVRDASENVAKKIEFIQLANVIPQDNPDSKVYNFFMPFLESSGFNRAEFVFKKDKDEGAGSPENPSRMSLAFFLDMTNLGALKIDVLMYNKTLNIGFSSEREDSLNLLRGGAANLKKNLVSHGFIVENILFRKQAKEEIEPKEPIGVIQKTLQLVNIKV